MNMNKRLDRAIILILVLILIGIGISSCAKPNSKEPNPTQQPNISVYNGTLSKILGCMFAPNECEKLKKQESQEDLQDEITEEMMEMDEDISKDNK